MKLNFVYSFCLTLVFISFLSCSSDVEQQKSKDDDVSISIKDKDGESVNITIGNSNELKDAFKEIGKAFEEAGNELGNVDLNIEDENGEKVEVVSAQELKSVLPRNIAGLGRQNTNSNKSGAFGVKVSTIEANYEEDDERVEVKIVDIGGMGMLANRWIDWADMEIDKEDSDGSYEKTITLEGHKAFEKYNARSERYELAAFPFDRFIVSIKGKNVSLRKLKSAFDDIQDELEDLID